MNEHEVHQVVDAVLADENSLPSQRRILLRLQSSIPAVDWFGVALSRFPEWDPDVDAIEGDRDWFGWVAPGDDPADSRSSTATH